MRLKHFRDAHRYLSEISPDKNLSNYKLYIRTDSKEIVYFGEDIKNKGALINASKFGQLLFANSLVVIPVGKQLEQVRTNVLSWDKDLEQSMRSKKVIPLNTILTRHGIG